MRGTLTDERDHDMDAKVRRKVNKQRIERFMDGLLSAPGSPEDFRRNLIDYFCDKLNEEDHRATRT